jgi:hypothetical protein
MRFKEAICALNKCPQPGVALLVASIDTSRPATATRPTSAAWDFDTASDPKAGRVKLESI